MMKIIDRSVKVSGIYCIFNMVNEKTYIGSSNHIHNRIAAHFSSLRSGKHYNSYFQSAFDKHGSDNFDWYILRVTNELEKVEQYYLDQYESYNPEFGYNLSAKVGRLYERADKNRKIDNGRLNKKFTADQCDKASEGRRRHKGITEEMEQKAVDMYYDKVHIDEIQKFIGISDWAALRRVFRRYHCPKRKPTVKYIGKTKEKQIIDLSLKGISQKKIAKIVGCDPLTVGNLQKMKNLPNLLDSKLHYKSRHESVMKLFSDGVSKEGIVEKSGYSPRQVRDIIRKYNQILGT